jgi:protein-S-isoprenylcysteine O-methyltransferase Ste14
MKPGNFIYRSLLVSCFSPAVVMFLSGNARWLEGWLFSLWFDAMVLSNYAYLYWRNPALLAERSKAPGSDNQQPWDKALQTGMYAMGLAWLLIMPLDAQRFHWSPSVPLWLKVLGGGGLMPALYLIHRATVENAFLSTAVRIQDDRKQRVISTGIYGFVRHPLYLGCLLMLLGAPLLLGSLCGMIIGLIALAVLVGRIRGEEKLLLNGLNGYQEYINKVRYRLVPFVW